MLFSLEGISGNDFGQLGGVQCYGRVYCQILGKLVDRFFGFSKFQTLSEARSQLYQRRFLRPRRHFSAFFELYNFSFAPFQIFVIFENHCTVFCSRNLKNRKKRSNYRGSESNGLE